MRIGRIIITPTILVLSVAGTALSGSGMVVAAGHASSAHVVAASTSTTSSYFYHG